LIFNAQIVCTCFEGNNKKLNNNKTYESCLTMENVPPHSLLFDANYCGLDDRGVTETVLIC